MEVTIEKANLDDIEGLVHVYNGDGSQHARELESYPLTQWLLDDKSHFLVAKVSRKPIGFIFVRKKGNEVKIDMFSVLKKYKAKGVDKRLLDYIEGMEDASKVMTYVPKSDKAMLSLFKKQEYFTYNEVKNLFGEGENGMYLIKDLAKIQKQERDKKATKSEKAARSFLEENLGKLDIYLKP